MKISIVVGNPKPNSRTRLIAESLVAKLVDPPLHDITVIDLADHASRIFAWPSDEMAALNATAAESDLVLIASPTYKATYTGLLKGFLDRYSADGLRGVVAIPIATGADLVHSMGPEVHLRPLLVELGAIVPTRSLYFVTSQMDQMSAVLDDWMAINERSLRPLLPAPTLVAEI